MIKEKPRKKYPSAECTEEENGRVLADLTAKQMSSTKKLYTSRQSPEPCTDWTIPSRNGFQAFLPGEQKPPKDTLESTHFTILEFYSNNNKMSPGFGKSLF